MKFAVAAEHRDFFNKNGYIEFADLMTDDQLSRLYEDIRQALVNRLNLPTHFSLEKKSPAELFAKGRDLWRDLPSIRKAVFNPSFAEIAWEFCQLRPMRIGLVQYLPATASKAGLSSDKNVGHASLPLSKAMSLLEWSPIQGSLNGLILCLKGSDSSEPTTAFPTTPGHGVFFSVDHRVDFSELDPQCEYLIITYANKKAVYIHNENDPLGHDLRQWGYNFGDALNDRLHPIILR